MANSPLLDKLRAGEASIGTYIETPNMVELCAHLGFDWFAIDQMFTATDWGRTEELIRAGEAAGITPVVRVQSHPWLGHDSRIAVDVSRAQGVGAQFIFVSHSDVQEIEAAVEVSRDWHRKLFTIHPYDSLEEWRETRQGTDKQTFVIPHPETEQSLASIEEVMRLDGVELVFIAMTDATRVLTGDPKPDWYDQRIWDYVDRVVELGEKHGVAVGANTSYAYNLPELQQRIGVLKDHGVKMILVQGAMFLFQIALRDFVRDAKQRIA